MYICVHIDIFKKKILNFYLVSKNYALVKKNIYYKICMNFFLLFFFTILNIYIYNKIANINIYKCKNYGGVYLCKFSDT